MVRRTATLIAFIALGLSLASRADAQDRLVRIPGGVFMIGGSGGGKVIRGGSWHYPSIHARVRARSAFGPASIASYIGFRIA